MSILIEHIVHKARVDRLAGVLAGRLAGGHAGGLAGGLGTGVTARLSTGVTARLGTGDMTWLLGPHRLGTGDLARLFGLHRLCTWTGRRGADCHRSPCRCTGGDGSATGRRRRHHHHLFRLVLAARPIHHRVVQLADWVSGCAPTLRYLGGSMECCGGWPRTGLGDHTPLGVGCFVCVAAIAGVRMVDAQAKPKPNSCHGWD